MFIDAYITRTPSGAIGSHVITLNEKDDALTVLGAAYGSGDVTQKVQSLQSTLDANASVFYTGANNKVFGDPWKGVRKSMVMVYQYEAGKPLVKVAVEGQTMVVKTRLSSVVSAKPLTVLGAAYGRSDVTERVRGLIKDQSVSFSADNRTLGDGWVGIRKSLVIVYTYDDYDSVKSGEITVKTAVCKEREFMLVDPYITRTPSGKLANMSWR